MEILNEKRLAFTLFTIQGCFSIFVKHFKSLIGGAVLLDLFIMNINGGRQN